MEHDGIGKIQEDKAGGRKTLEDKMGGRKTLEDKMGGRKKGEGKIQENEGEVKVIRPKRGY